jgi:hypothetical protein
MTRYNTWFEIRSTDDLHGLCGTYETAEMALEEINNSHERAKAKGYDDRNDWLVVCVEVKREFNDKGQFLGEEKRRFVYEHAEYSTYDERYNFVY